MFIARIKYSRQAIPSEIEFATKEGAEQFCKDKEDCNPYVKWTEVDTERNYPIESIG